MITVESRGVIDGVICPLVNFLCPFIFGGESLSVQNIQVVQNLPLIEDVEIHNFYWDINRPLSYNALFNFIVGNRGGGKTYGCKKFVIKRFLKYKEEFIYLRRYKREFDDFKQFFADIAEEFPEHEFKVTGLKCYIDDELCGRGLVLSTSKIKKSVSYPKVTTIIFDEFIIDRGVYHYIQDEVTQFLECYETVSRMRDVRVFFLSNAITITNPYFLYFGLKIPYGSDISCKGDVLIQVYSNQDFIKAKKQTRFGKIIAGTKYEKYSVENEFLRDNKTFVEKKSGNCSLIFCFTYKGVVYGVWRSYSRGKMWVSLNYDQGYSNYVLTKDDLTPNTLLISSLRDSRNFKQFVEQYKNGNVYFESVNIKNICYEIMRLYSIY